MFLLPDYRVRQRDYLLNISRALTAQLDLGEVLRMILQAATSMLAGEAGIIALYDGEHFRTRAITGIPPDQAEVLDTLLEDLTYDKQDGFNVPALHGKMRKVARKMNLNLRQVVALPMIMADQMLGILFIFRTYAGQPTDNDHRLLQSFADQAAIAVHNAWMYEFANQERQRLAAIIDNSADGVMILDQHLHIERWNRALSRISGWHAEQVMTRPHDVIIRWRHVEVGMTLEDALRTGWPYGDADEDEADSTNVLYVEGDLERLDGTTISIGVTYAPLFRRTGELQNVIANVRDITHFREAERLKSTFISVVSHELKTPVALIKGYADTLRREDADWDADTFKRGLGVIEEEADRLTELIENLLAASKLQAEGMQLQLDDVNLRGIAEQAVERFQTQTGNHTLRADFPDDFPIICGDGTRLRQVVDNLVSNAIKYSPKGGKIVIKGTFDDKHVQVSVRDEGPGLPEEELSRVFERFYRVNNALTNNAQGTGLGLYLANAVVKAHGGRIWANNNPSGGATFTFTIPRQD
ncbi:MAG TPA: ATP-binding protein [Aggregatilinea sp.]|uniref:ATP-binding protein n=1 Tax=Aggregatilinea sp. TaxID=2806333 RepID=UPI002CBB4CDF|nr:ATP-binding protein [Aggregatilinea sp.]HML23480.1 ATP-binding protein [Aggregatilinea sp.]